MVEENDVLEMMARSEAVYLATARGGAPRLRALVNLRRPDRYPRTCDFCRNERFTCYFCTSSASGKVNDIRAGSPVAVYYSDPGQVRGVELRGTMEILTDPQIKRMLWQDEWNIYWTGGADDPDYVVLRLKPERADGWWGIAPFQLDVNQA
jgi:general stress protein 26